MKQTVVNFFIYLLFLTIIKKGYPFLLFTKKSCQNSNKFFHRRILKTFFLVEVNPCRLTSYTKICMIKSDVQQSTEENRPLMNEEIKVPRVRCVIANPEGDIQLGVVDTTEALAKANELGVDLIIIASNADPPVCKIIDFGKYKYMSEKKKKDSKKNARQTELKEVKMSYKIEEHDYQVRLKSAKKFISQGNRVKVVIQFKGREQQHMDLGQSLIQKLISDFDGVVISDGIPKREGNRLSVIIAPKAAS